jgi:hypothetical protein
MRMLGKQNDARPESRVRIAESHTYLNIFCLDSLEHKEAVHIYKKKFSVTRRDLFPAPIALIAAEKVMGT